MKKPADIKKTAPARPRSEAFRLTVVAVFFPLCFLYVWLRIEPALEYYAGGVAFSLSGSFLRRFLDYPGGLADYAAAFLAQLNYLSWLGALAFTLLAGLLFLAASRLCRQLTGGAPPLICLAPALLLLAWRGQYDGRALDAGLRLFLAVGGALGCVPILRRPLWIRWPAYGCVGAAVFYLAGHWSFLLFLFLAGWCAANQSRKWPQVAVLVVGGMLLGPLGWAACRLPPPHWDDFGTGRARYFGGALLLLLPAGLWLLAWRGKPRPPTPAPAPAVRPRKSTGAKQRDSQANGAWWSLENPVVTVGGLLAGWVAVWCLFNGSENKLGRIEYYAAHQQDDQLLAVAAQLQPIPPAAEIRMQLALYHTGRLSRDLFAFPNSGEEMLLPGLGLDMGGVRAQIQTLLELGQVNDAEHMAHESLESDGDRPDVLRALALVNIIKNRPEAAKVFLHVLRQMPFQRDWANAYLVRLEQNPRLTGDAEIDALRARMPATDYPHGAIASAVEAMLRQLLASHRQNPMAYEYLLAQYLLTGDFAKLADAAGKLPEFKYTAIPRQVEEALLLGQQLEGVQFDLPGLQIQPDTLRRFQNFREALGRLSGRAPDSLAALAPEFGDTFWYYYYACLKGKYGGPA